MNCTCNAAVVASLRACAKQKDLHKGRSVHADILRKGILGKDNYVASALVNMYAKCGALATSARVFDELPVRSLISWTAIIGGHVDKGQGEKALKYFEWMQSEGLQPDTVTFVSILKACGSIGETDKAQKIHSEIVRQGLAGKDIMLGTALVDMYVKCGQLAKAAYVFDELPVRNIFSWSVLISGFALQGRGDEALQCFRQMQYEGISPNEVTYICILKACGCIGALDEGKQIHEEVVHLGFLEDDIDLGNTLMDMYVRCGALAEAIQLLDDLPVRNTVSWTVLIAALAQQGQGEDSLNCFECMQLEGLPPDTVTFIFAMKACGSIGVADKGEQIHTEIVKRKLFGQDVLLGSALVDMYAKCGDLAKAAHVHRELPLRNAVSWSSLISGYVQHEQSEEALRCFEWMEREGFSPTTVTLSCILKACGSIGAVDKGVQIHQAILKQGLVDKDVVLVNTLVDMYVKCGVLSKAELILDELPVRNVVPWNALIAGYAEQGHSEKALMCLECMQHERIYPDAITWTCLLNACTSLDEIHMCFVKMGAQYDTTTNLQHYACMVDFFGRVGEFEKAIAVMKKTSYSDYFPLWLALLSTCGECGNVELGRWAFHNVI